MLKKICAGLGATLLVIGLVQQAFAKSAPPGTGYLDVPTNVLIMLDVSTSMNADIFSGSARYPNNTAFESDNDFFIARYSDSVIEKYSSSGEYMMDWGEYGTGTSQFDNIFDIDVDSSNNVYASDRGNGRVQKFTTMGVYVRSYTLSTTTGARGITVDSTNGWLYALNNNGTVEKFNISTGARLATWTNTGGYMLAKDTSGNIYVTNYTAKTVTKYDSNGTLLLTFSTRKAPTGSPTTFNPYGIEVSSTGDIYVSDSVGAKVYKYDSAGTVSTTIYSPSGSARYREPRGLTADTTGKIWVTDFSDSSVKDLTGTSLFSTASHETRLDQAKRVVKDLVTNSDLTARANFGLLTFGSSATLNVPISSTGASSIYSTIDSISTIGGVKDMDDAMDTAKTYLTGSSSPVVADAWCQDDLIVVISDGFFVDNTASDTAEYLYNNFSIKTFPVGFLVSSSNSAADNYITLATKGGTYPDGPVFADNWQQLYSAVTDFILSIINANLTFSAPTIMPEITGTDHIVQATFKYKTTHQWKGNLNKYALDEDGSIGDLQWNAGTVLAATPAASRNIWTVNTGLTTSLNNFVTTNIDYLRVPLLENSGTAYTDTQLQSLISFVRGVDSYSEFTDGVDDEGDTIIAGERWKLADIYHSRAVIVGTPDAYTSETANSKTEAYYRYANGYNTFKNGAASTRDTVVYVGSNGGMVHAFDFQSGEEKWAFIPPSILSNLVGSISSTSNQSTPIYGVDGSPVVKDVYYGGSWRTILMVGARQGGHTYTALDVTDPDNPSHLFTFVHNKRNSQVSYWNSTGTRTDYSTSTTITSEYDYSNLGEAWSQPVILRLPVGTSGAMVWTAVFGGGYNSATATNYGAKLFVINLEDGGKIIQKLDIADTISSNGIVSSIPPRILPINADSSTLFQSSTDPEGSIIYFSDLEGKLWKINLTNQGTLYETNKLFNAESTSTNTRYVFQQNAATVNSSSDLYQFYGTGNELAMGQISSSIANRIYGIKNASVMTGFSTTTMATVSNLADVANGACPTSSQLGWYEDLDANEKVSGRATVYNGIVLFPRYTASTSLCSAGTAKITEHDYTCGTVERETDLGYGVPTEAIVYKNKIYMGISTDQTEVTLPEGFTKEGNLIVGTPVNPTNGAVDIESWWEDF